MLATILYNASPDLMMPPLVTGITPLKVKNDWNYIMSQSSPTQNNDYNSNGSKISKKSVLVKKLATLKVTVIRIFLFCIKFLVPVDICQ
jgi:hypothetical protein